MHPVTSKYILSRSDSGCLLSHAVCIWMHAPGRAGKCSIQMRPLKSCRNQQMHLHASEAHLSAQQYQ